MVVVVLVVMLAAALVVVIVLVVMSAAALVVVIVLMVMSVAALVVVIMLVVMSAAALVVVIVLMVMTVMVMLLQKRTKGVLQRVALLHGTENILTVQRVPGRRDKGCLGVVLTKLCHRRHKLLLVHALRMRQNNRRGTAHLVVKELAEVLHIHFALFRINDGGEAVELGICVLHGRGGANNVGQLADARGLDDDAVGVVFVDDRGQRLGEITDEGAADAARIHLGDLNTCLLQKSAVDTDLAELVFDENDLLACVGLV